MTLTPPEGQSFVLLGARDLPVPATLKDLQQAELGNIRAIAGKIDVADEEGLKVAGFDALSWTFTMTLGVERKRREVFFIDGRRLFFLVADAVPASDYPKIAAGIEEIIASLAFGK